MGSKSIASEYRKMVNSDSLAYEELSTYGYDDGKENLVPVSAAIGVISLIEDDVNEVVNLLDNIQGLTEIDEAKGLLKVLSCKLY